jgi:hypothetical protein
VFDAATDLSLATTKGKSASRRDAKLRSGAFDQFEAIAEGIEDVDASEIVERGVGLRRKTGEFAGGDDIVKAVDNVAVDNECRVSAPCRVKIGLDSKMKIHGTCDEPDAVAFCYFSWLFDFGQPEDSAVELACARLAAHRNCDLNVIETKDWHGTPMVALDPRRPRVTRRNNCRVGQGLGT